MKNKTQNLEADFIGGQEPLTKEEEALISEFIKTLKAKREKEKLQLKKIKQKIS